MNMHGLEMSDEERSLWARVEELWRLASARDEAAIRAALHPSYSGWERGKPEPHDREFAIKSVMEGPLTVTSYELQPLGVSIGEGAVGTVHYRYRATLAPDHMDVTGRWTEVYLRRGDAWIMVAVSGGLERQ